MVFKTEEKIILKAIMTRLEITANTAAYTPMRRDDLKIGIDERLVDIALEDMAKRGLLLVSGDHITLSDMGTNAYSLLTWMEKNMNDK